MINKTIISVFTCISFFSQVSASEKQSLEPHIIAEVIFNNEQNRSYSNVHSPIHGLMLEIENGEESFFKYDTNDMPSKAKLEEPDQQGLKRILEIVRKKASKRKDFQNSYSSWNLYSNGSCRCGLYTS